MEQELNAEALMNEAQQAFRFAFERHSGGLSASVKVGLIAALPHLLRLESTTRTPSARELRLEAALRDCAEMLELSLARLGCPVEGNDGGGAGRHDAESFGGISALKEARAALEPK